MATAFNPTYPTPDRSKQIVQHSKGDDGAVDIRWCDGVMSDGRAFRAEMWAQDGVRLGAGRRERAMARFRRMRTLQKFASVHASVHNHFAQERHPISRQDSRERRSAALAEWRTVVG
jgi:hypothetical protein